MNFEQLKYLDECLNILRSYIKMLVPGGGKMSFVWDKHEVRVHEMRSELLKTARRHAEVSVQETAEGFTIWRPL